MATLTLIWIALPLFAGFIIYLLPKLSLVLPLIVSAVSLGYGLCHVLYLEPISLSLVDSFGVS